MKINASAINIDSNVKQLEQYIENLLPTVRDVKRFYSLFISDYVGIQDEVHFYDFLLVTLIKYKNKDLYKNLAYGKYVVEHDRVPTFYIFKLSVKSTYEEKILASLFPNPKHPIEYYFRHDYRKLCRKNSFDHYFYNYEEGRLYFKDLNKLLSTGYLLADAFALIKKWNEEGKEEDYNDYLLTYININIDISRDKLRRYWQILAYCCVYSGLVTSYQKILLDFIRPDYVDLILKKQAFSDLSDYKNYFENSIYCTNDDKIVTSIFGSHLYDILNERKKSIFGLDELLYINRNSLRYYLNQSNKDNWDIELIIQMFKGCAVKRDDSRTDEYVYDASACSFLRKHMNDYPYLYTDKLLSHIDFSENIAIVLAFPYNEVLADSSSWAAFISRMDDDTTVSTLDRQVITMFWNQAAGSFPLTVICSINEGNKIKKGDYKTYIQLLKARLLNDIGVLDSSSEEVWEEI